MEYFDTVLLPTSPRLDCKSTFIHEGSRKLTRHTRKNQLGVCLRLIVR